MLRLSLIAAATLSGCCTLMPGRDNCDAAKYAQGWTHNVLRGAEKPRCTDDLLAVADTLLPDPSLRPLHGVVQWHPGPFWCGQMVWGCSSPEKSWVSVAVVGLPGVHASDTALAEEVAHWVWFRYRPGVLTEEWRAGAYWRDPDFQRWYQLVAAETRGLCK